MVNSRLTELVLAENLSGTDAEKEIISTRKWIPEMKAEGAELIIVLNSSAMPWDREMEYKKLVQKHNILIHEVSFKHLYHSQLI